MLHGRCCLVVMRRLPDTLSSTVTSDALTNGDERGCCLLRVSHTLPHWFQPWLLPCADGQPLLPAACALALMPRPASQHAPTALQHLMSRESPISDVFDECEECARLRVSESTTQAVRIASACLLPAASVQIALFLVWMKLIHSSSLLEHTSEILPVHVTGQPFILSQ